jgi:hypothetical protein
MKSRTIQMIVCLAMILVGPFLMAAETPLADLDTAAAVQGWQRPQADVSVAGYPLGIGGVAYETGLGIHAPFSWKLSLAGKATAFRALVGVQDARGQTKKPGSVEFIVRGDGNELFKSGVMRSGMAAKKIEVPLAGVQELELVVTDGGDGNNSDHADWIEAVIVHDGAPLPVKAESSLLPDLPGEPANAGVQVEWNEAAGTLALTYDGKTIFSGRAMGAKLAVATARKRQAITQTLVLTGKNLRLEGTLLAGVETIAAETRGPAQQRFPLIRTTIGGPSSSLRNNAIYDRGRDWLLEAPAATRIVPTAATADTRTFTIVASGDEIRLAFRPRYYQRHKNIVHFRPWTYKIRQDSITGWSSWWAFMRDCSQKDCDALLAVWKGKRFADYGYKYIQLDDCFQNEFGQGQARPIYPGTGVANYVARGPETWLDWRRDIYPAGINGYVNACRNAGFEPGLWIGTFFTDNELITKHPDWFIRGPDGKPTIAPCASCGVDGTNPEALEALVRKTFRCLRQAGISYVKIDQLRHYLYGNIHRNLDYCKAHGVTPDEMYRKYFGAIREEIGPDTFLLSCWGVLPESVGIADACRIAGDGYGPVTMQQYNSWNGIVWINDPDHCDVYPRSKPAAETGDVTRTAAVAAAAADTVIRPALASLAGCMLMLSDRPQVYADEANLHGLRRSSPVLASVPGQLYDFTPDRSRNLITIPRTAITSGYGDSFLDARKTGEINPWWLNEFHLPCGQWVVLHRLNWNGPAIGETTVKLADLGLDDAREYVAYEFWSQRYLGICKGELRVPGLPAKGIASIALRQKLDRPQIVSTNRHLSQGGADLVKIDWTANALAGTSKVVNGDRYELAVRVPAGYVLKSAVFDGKPALTSTDGELLRASFVPAATGEVEWSLSFSIQP